MDDFGDVLSNSSISHFSLNVSCFKHLLQLPVLFHLIKFNFSFHLDLPLKELLIRFYESDQFNDLLNQVIEFAC